MFVAWVLVVTLPSPAVAEPGDREGAAVEEPVRVAALGQEDSAADVVAAGVRAKVSGRPVGVESLTDEFSTTLINPDGSFTTEQAAGPVRFRGEDGQWQDIDVDLVEGSQGQVVPVSHPLGLSVGSLAGQGKGVRVSHPGGGRQVSWQLPLRGEPEVVGNRAVYADAWPGVDVAVDARRSGFEQTFVVRDRQAVGGLAGGERVQFTVPVVTKGLTAREGRAGAVEFVDAKGTVVSTVVAPEAFDARVDERSGQPVATTPVDLEVRPTAGKGRAELVVSPLLTPRGLTWSIPGPVDRCCCPRR